MSWQLLNPPHIAASVQTEYESILELEPMLRLLYKIYLRTGRNVWIGTQYSHAHRILKTIRIIPDAACSILLREPNEDNPRLRSRRASLEAEDQIGSHRHGTAARLTTSVIRELGRDP